MRQSLLKNLHFNLSIAYHNWIPFISQLDSVCFTDGFLLYHSCETQRRSDENASGSGSNPFCLSGKRLHPGRQIQLSPKHLVL